MPRYTAPSKGSCSVYCTVVFEGVKPTIATVVRRTSPTSPTRWLTYCNCGTRGNITAEYPPQIETIRIGDLQQWSSGKLWFSESLIIFTQRDGYLPSVMARWPACTTCTFCYESCHLNSTMFTVERWPSVHQGCWKSTVVLGITKKAEIRRVT